MIIAAFDLGTNAGWAVWDGDQFVDAGTEVLASKEEITQWGKQRLTRTLDPRIPRMHVFARDLVTSHRAELVVWEDVLFASSRKQAHLWASFRTALWLACWPEVELDCLDTTKLKIFAARNGGATKEQMSIALHRSMPDKFRLIERNKTLLCVHCDTGKVYDDNAVDAIHLARWAKQTYR